MAKGKFITDLEREVIRVGYHFGIEQKKVAKSLGRSEGAVSQQIQRMVDDGNIGELPLPFMQEIIRKGLDA